MHRRFQEYFCARYLRNHAQDAPLEYLFHDNRWREVLVLLSEVMPKNDLQVLLSIAHKAIEDGLKTTPNSKEHRNAIETLQFLKDGFRFWRNDSVSCQKIANKTDSLDINFSIFF